MLVILQQLPLASSLAQLAAQMSSVSANIRKIISRASAHQRPWHCCRHLLEFVLRLLTPDSQGADVCKAAWPVSLLKCRLLTELLSPVLLSPYSVMSLRNFSKQLIFFITPSPHHSFDLSLYFPLLLWFVIPGQMTFSLTLLVFKVVPSLHCL